MKIKIAVVQFKIKRLSPKINLKKAESFIKKASRKGAQIIIFPEDFITDPLVKNIEFADKENKYKKHFQALAKRYHIDIIPGSVIEKDKRHLYNTSYYIESTGKIKTKYRKINLWHPERSYISPGKEISIFNTKFGKFGLIICWDLMFPKIFNEMIKNNVKIIFCPSYWCYGDAGKIGNSHDKNSEIKLVDSVCSARAFENEVAIVYCNAAGKLELEKYPDTLIGHSQITIPFKGAIRKLNHNKEEMFIEEIDTEILKDAEKVYKIKKDLNNKKI
jgi:predicted amidohydrolase